MYSVRGLGIIGGGAPLAFAAAAGGIQNLAIAGIGIGIWFLHSFNSFDSLTLLIKVVLVSGETILLNKCVFYHT